MMEQRPAKYYRGTFHSQLISEKSKEEKGWKSMNIRLEQRFVLKVEHEISIEDYEAAKKVRLSEDSIKWQSTNHSGYQHEVKELQPHVLLTENNDIELEFPDGSSVREVCSELYVEFGEGVVSDEFKSHDFIASKDGVYHGRMTGKGLVRIPIFTEEEKATHRRQIDNREMRKRKGCLAPLLPAPTSPSLFGGLFGTRHVGGMRGGCGRTGCGLLSLLFLLGILLSLWKSCQNKTGAGDGKRVIHDTVYVDEKSKQDVIKQFMDTTTIFKTEAVELPNVQFFTNSAKLLPYSINSIQQLAEYLIAHPQIHAVIEGHTDNVGDPEANLKLSQQRAETVREVVISFGVEANRVEARGYGKNKPRASNETVEGRALNRRVEVRLLNTEHSETKSTEILDEH